MSMKISLTPAGIEPATFRFVAQHLNHCATAVPLSPDIVRVIRSRRMIFEGHVIRMGEKRNSCRILVGNPLENTACIWQVGIQKGLKGVG